MADHLAVDHPAVEAGALGFVALVRELRRQSDSTAPDEWEDSSAIDAAVDAAIVRHLQHPDPGHRQGFLRALSNALLELSLGLVPNVGEAEYVTDTLRTFERQRGG